MMPYWKNFRGAGIWSVTMAIAVFGGTCTTAFAEPGTRQEKGGAEHDWPAYKRDVARSSVTASIVTLPVRELWSYASVQAPRPAWAEPGRSLNMLDFDYCFQPVAADGLIVFGSSADDTVRALKADSGQVAWA